MRTNELVRALVGLLVVASTPECGRSDHVHVKIHVPDVIHKHRHIKTKLVHVYHPQKIIHDHSSLHLGLGRARHGSNSRRDPNIDIVNGGYPQTLIKTNLNPGLRISEEEFNKWRQQQERKAWEKRKKSQSQNDDAVEPADYEENETEDEQKDAAYKNHRGSSSYGRDESSKHKNHNYNHNQDYEASNSDKSYANYPSRHSNKKQQTKSSQTVERPSRQPKPKTKANYQQPMPEASNNQPQVYIDPTSIDPTYYRTLPMDQNAKATKLDDIYSGLLSAQYNKQIADKSKLLGDLNYSRKKQAKAVSTQQTRTNQ